MKTLATLLVALLLAAARTRGRSSAPEKRQTRLPKTSAIPRKTRSTQSMTLSTMWKTRSKTRLNRAVRTSHPEAAHSMQRAG